MRKLWKLWRWTINTKWLKSYDQQKRRECWALWKCLKIDENKEHAGHCQTFEHIKENCKT